MLKPRDIHQVDAGYIADKNSGKLLQSNEAVDEFAESVTALMKESGFYLTSSSISWGLQPLTGHTQNLNYKIPGRDLIYCSITISKSKFTAVFKELEMKPQSGTYVTTEDDRESINRAASALNELAKEEFKGRSTRVSVYDNPAGPNKTRKPTQ